MRRADDPHGRRGAVLLVVGMQDEKSVHCPCENGVGVKAGLGRFPHHRQEVGGEAEGVVRVDKRHPHAEAVGRGRERRHFRDQPDNLLVADVRIEDLLGLGVEGGQRRDGRDEHPHGMGVVVETLEETLAHVLVNKGVVGDLLDPVVELLGIRELSVQDEVGDLEVARLLGQLLDRVTAVLEDPVVAVDKGDRALGCGRCHEGRIVEPDAGQEFAPLLCRHSAVDDRDLDRLTVAVIRDRHAVYHDLHLLSAPARLTSLAPRLTFDAPARAGVATSYDCAGASYSAGPAPPLATPPAGHLRGPASNVWRGPPWGVNIPLPKLRWRSPPVATRTRKQDSASLARYTVRRLEREALACQPSRGGWVLLAQALRRPTHPVELGPRAC